MEITSSRLLPDAEVGWAADLDRVLTRPEDLRLVFQPIVDVAQGRIAGYETLARFLDADGAPSTRPPDQWFAAADARGLGARLEAVVLERCIRLREDLPANCFLTVNVSPHLITSPELADPLLAAGDLSGLVIEFTEHETVPNLKPLLDMREVILDRGALVALDDAGSGYSGLQQLTSFRPQMIKLDRALVAGIDHDEVKLALAEMLGEFGGRIDAWLLAEGVETWGEMEAFLRLGVPLAQGWLLGRPGPPWVQLDAGVAARLRQQHARTRLAEEVVSLVEQVPLLDEGRMPPGDRMGVEVDRYRHPLALLLPHRRAGDVAGHRRAPISLRVPTSASVTDVAQRIAARPEECRFDPVVCVDDIGAVAGIVRVERVLLRLAERRSRDGG